MPEFNHFNFTLIPLQGERYKFLNKYDIFFHKKAGVFNRLSSLHLNYFSFNSIVLIFQEFNLPIKIFRL
jgi:hypothetical protein